MRTLTAVLLLTSFVSRGQSTFNKGLACLDSNNLVCALETFENLYQTEQSDSTGYYLALTHYLLEDDQSAIRILKKVIVNSPGYVYPTLLLSEIYYLHDGFSKAAKPITTYIDSFPDNCLAYQARVELYLTEFEPDAFLAENLETSLYFCSDSQAVKSLLLLGSVYFDIGYYKRARNVYDELIELAPDDPTVQYDVASYYAEVGAYEKSIELYEQYAQSKPNDIDVHFQLGYCHMAVENYSKSVRSYTDYIRSDSSYADAWYNRGLANAAMKEYAFAIRDLEQTLQLDPENMDALFNLALVYENKGEYLKAVDYYTNYITQNLNDPEAYYHRGISKYYSDDEHGACGDWSKLTELGRKDLWKEVRSLCDK